MIIEMIILSIFS